MAQNLRTPNFHAMTLDEVAKAEGLSRRQVWELEKRALRKLRRFGFLEEHLQATADMSRKCCPHEEP